MARSKGVVVQISAEDNSARAFESVQAQVTRLREQVAALRAQSSRLGATEAMEDLSHASAHAVTDVQATSAAIRALEGNPGIRAVEQFVARTLNLGPALLKVFSVIGAVDLGMVLVDDAKKLWDMHEAAQNAGKAMHDAFAQAEAEARLANDALRVSNDRLQDTLDKLEHKPENGAALALDQVAEAADKAGEAIQKDINKLDELLATKNKVSFLGRLENNADTKDDAAMIGGYDKQISATTSSYQYDIDRAADRGEKGNVDKLRIDQAVALQKVYAEATQRVTAALRDAEIAQDDYENKHVGSNQTSRIEQLKTALGMWQEQQQRIGGGLRATDLQSKIDPLQAKKGNDEAARKAEEAAQKLQEARQKGADAAVKLAEQGAQAEANAQKRAADLELAALDSKHKQALISDRDFYAERTRIQTDALAAEAAAMGAKSQDVQGQLTGAIQQRGKDSGNPLKQTADDTRIIELQTQLGKLNEDRLKVEEQIQRLKQDGVALDTEAADKALDASQKLAAQLEAVRGGTSARTAQSDTQYTRRREEMVAQNAPAQDLTNEDALHGIETAGIKVKGAEQEAAPKVAGIQTQRTGVDDEVRRGQLSTVQAQQEKIALDREEADALQPVLAAYRELAAQGDIAASEKVAQLAQRITELRDPVNETAAEIRNQFDGAFETLFENLDKGQKAWQDFAKSLQKDVLKDTYKQFVQPAVQMGMGMLVPNGGRDNLSAPGNQAASSAIGGLLPKLMPSLARPTFPGGTAAAQPVVNIINNSSQPMQGSASSQQGDLTDMIRPSVIQVVLENMQTGGSIGQALAGVGMGLLA